MSTLNVILVGLLLEKITTKPPPQKVTFLINVFLVVKAVRRLGLRTAYWHYFEEKTRLEFMHIFAFLCSWDSSYFPYLPGSRLQPNAAPWVRTHQRCTDSVRQSLKDKLWTPVYSTKRWSWESSTPQPVDGENWYFSVSVDKWSSSVVCYSFYFIWSIA